MLTLEQIRRVERRKKTYEDGSDDCSSCAALRAEIECLRLALYHAARDMLFLKDGPPASPDRVVRSAKDYAEMMGATWPDDPEPPPRAGKEQDP